MGGRLKILLVVSLVLNVFLAGAVAGAFIVRGRLAEMAGPPSPRGPGFGRGLQALAPEDRLAFREAMRGRAAAVEPILREARAARSQAVEEFAKPTFDKAAALAALARARENEAKARAQLEDGVVAFAADLPPEKREALGRSLRRGGAMMGMGRRGGRHGSEGGGMRPDQGPPQR